MEPTYGQNQFLLARVSSGLYVFFMFTIEQERTTCDLNGILALYDSGRIQIFKCLLLLKLYIMYKWCLLQSPEKHDFLLQQLENYSREGLPSMPSLLTFGKPQYDEATFTMEEHWSKLCDVNPEELSKKQRDQQMSIWELLCTELEHVRKLNVVIDVSKYNINLC